MFYPRRGTLRLFGALGGIAGISVLRRDYRSQGDPPYPESREG